MWNLILDFCPFFVGFSTVCVMFEKTFGKLFYVNFLVDLDPFRMGGRFWAKKSRKWSSGLILQSKLNFLEIFYFFFGNFVITVIIFGNLTKTVFRRKIIFHLTQVPSRCDESSHHFFNINLGEMTKCSILASFWQIWKVISPRAKSPG